MMQLTLPANKTVSLINKLNSLKSPGTLTGRTVLILFLLCLSSRVSNAQLSFQWNCDFEANENCSFIEMDTSAENTWVIAKPQKVFFDSAYSNEGAILTDSINPYPPDNYSYFDIPITLKYGNITFDFRHKYDTDTLEDGGYITISYDSGSTWYNILDVSAHIDTFDQFSGWTQYSNSFYTDSSILVNGERGFSGNSGDWMHTQFTLYWYEAVSFNDFRGFGDIIVRFNFISDSVDNAKEGWMIDSLKIFEERRGNINELNQQNFNLFPNPANDVLHISLKNPATKSNYRYTITDITGRVIERQQFTGEQKIEVSSWKKGIYIVTVYKGDMAVGIRKLVVI